MINPQCRSGTLYMTRCCRRSPGACRAGGRQDGALEAAGGRAAAMCGGGRGVCARAQAQRAGPDSTCMAHAWRMRA
eukprot:scaffold9300_cov59-Phaeocystis_antarctica.AAC.6